MSEDSAGMEGESVRGRPVWSITRTGSQIASKVMPLTLWVVSQGLLRSDNPDGVRKENEIRKALMKLR